MAHTKTVRIDNDLYEDLERFIRTEAVRRDERVTMIKVVNEAVCEYLMRSRKGCNSNPRED
jgi:hypothetical protein